eukprot:776951-Rhodomonas_salina.1
MAEVIFLVFFTELTRSRRSLMPMTGPAARLRGAARAGAWLIETPRNADGARVDGVNEKADVAATQRASFRMARSIVHVWESEVIGV